MVNRSKISYSCGINKVCGSKFPLGSLVRQIHEEGRIAYRPNPFQYNNKDDDNNLKTLNNKNDVLKTV